MNTKNKFLLQIFETGLVFMPMFAFAQNPGGVKSLLVAGGNIITHILVPMAAALALLFFFWGLAKFVFKLGNGDEGAVEEGRQIMIWGVIALFCIVAVWGIVSLIRNDLGINDIQNITAPRIR